MYRPFNQFVPEKRFISVIGSGGKTTLLSYLAARLPGTVILTTSTHIFPFPGLPLIDTSLYPPEKGGLAADAVRRVLSAEKTVVLGNMEPSGKLSSPSRVIPFESLLTMADYVIVEADGAAGRPLKAHRSFEPVIPACSELTIGVAGASAIGRPAGEVCHCADIFCGIAGISPDTPVSPGHIAQVLNYENLADCYLINQIDVLPAEQPAREICDLLKKEAYCCALASSEQSDQETCLQSGIRP